MNTDGNTDGNAGDGGTYAAGTTGGSDKRAAGNADDGHETDALMAVLLGEPAPEGDGPAVRRHEAARRDMEVLGAQLRLIGDRLGASEPGTYGIAPTAPMAPTASTAPRPRRGRPRGRTLALAACAVLAVGLAGAGLLRAIATSAAEEEGYAAKLTEEGIVACARLVVDGTVVRTERVAPGVRVVLDVERSLKPERAPARAAFLVPGEEADLYRPGAPVTVVVSRFPDEPVMAYTEDGDRADAWARLSAALPAARGLECPGRG
ncbi:hypothetical protein B7C62_09950 [Kitasatospora albolonga]|uniref:Uncharacterized protein n=1 Tax=Kitasatospora albolonga TaxID=68173 RepID=A0ABC8BQJ9_9ACTN|nr:hypothetical protein B7C62_09950 [Kitasatospora albolonga]